MANDEGGPTGCTVVAFGPSAACATFGGARLLVVVIVNALGVVVDRHGDAVRGNREPESGTRNHVTPEDMVLALLLDGDALWFATPNDVVVDATPTALGAGGLRAGVGRDPARRRLGGAVILAYGSSAVEVRAGVCHWLQLADPQRIAHRLSEWVRDHGR